MIAYIFKIGFHSAKHSKFTHAHLDIYIKLIPLPLILRTRHIFYNQNNIYIKKMWTHREIITKKKTYMIQSDLVYYSYFII